MVLVGRIRETFGNLILLSLFNQPNWYVYSFIFYCYVAIYLVLKSFKSLIRVL